MRDSRKLEGPVGLLVVLALVLAACGGAADDDASDQPSATTAAEDHAEDEAGHDEDEAGHDEAFTFGEPGDPDHADRTVEIEARDDLTFDPSEISVAKGETITFLITNSGSVVHDFTLGDAATQEAHEEEMAEMMASGGDMSMHTDANAVVVEAGDTVELTWTFTEAGEVMFGCHQPGHYSAGMVGMASVTA